MENHTKKVMLVEDNHDLLLNFHLILEDHKFKVTTAKDGKEALNILSDGKFIPDIIISDYDARGRWLRSVENNFYNA